MSKKNRKNQNAQNYANQYVVGEVYFCSDETAAFELGLWQAEFKTAELNRRIAAIKAAVVEMRSDAYRGIALETEVDYLSSVAYVGDTLKGLVARKIEHLRRNWFSAAWLVGMFGTIGFMVARIAGL